MTEGAESLGGKVALGITWLLSLAVVGYGGFAFGQNMQPIKQTEKATLSSLISQPPLTATPTTLSQAVQTVASSPAQTPACSKSGYAQKWEYLTPYTIQQGDSLPLIAKAELHDESRVNEILQLNGVGPLVVGATLYLPPPIITKSSGHIKQVSGKLIEKNASMWHVSFNENEKGMGILIPGYWFEKIPGKDSYQIGDCLTVLLDDGNTVFSVTRQ